MSSCSTGSCWPAGSAPISAIPPPTSPSSIGVRKKPQFCYVPWEFPSSSKSEDQKNSKNEGRRGIIPAEPRGETAADDRSQLGGKFLAADRCWLRRGLSGRAYRS